MLRIDEIRRAFAAHRPDTAEWEGKRRAAVAVLLRDAPGGPEVLFIERATHENDPWSGHMAFPGGRLDPGDPTPRAAAERETLEEVGIDLAEVDPLGRLDDMEGHHVAGVPRMVISAFVYHCASPPEPHPNHEVRQAFWFPLASLQDSGRHVGYRMRRPRPGTLPGILVGEPDRHVVWGLTYRFLEVFFRVVGQPLPDRWSRSASGSPPSNPEQRSTGSGG